MKMIWFKESNLKTRDKQKSLKEELKILKQRKKIIEKKGMLEQKVINGDIHSHHLKWNLMLIYQRKLHQNNLKNLNLNGIKNINILKMQKAIR